MKNIFIDTDKKILMPAYIGETDAEGSGVFDPVRENCVPYDFYQIKKDLSADLEELKTKIASGNFIAMVIIHYFGFIQNDIIEIQSLCRKNNVILIEDCAHSFHSSLKGETIGSWGDLAFFSIHKIIATPDGGYFQINNQSVRVPEMIFMDNYLSSATFEEYIRTDYDMINRIRIQNYKRYLDNWKEIPGVIPLYSNLPDCIVPLNFPIIVQNGLREKLYFKLVDRGIVPISSYYRLIDEIDRELYSVSYELSSSILNLPVHQDTQSEDIDIILFHIKKSMQELNNNA
ncbi:MAG: DegT/DnrJ/EryC1/StrS family aminotransferase [Candidatus Marinimicrobia bacterium]|nr:DegT/DnrJ/EryC1/StrS family aminotransferase [Candidatus Neomarinimicrobiota bacterium]